MLPFVAPSQFCKRGFVLVNCTLTMWSTTFFFPLMFAQSLTLFASQQTPLHFLTAAKMCCRIFYIKYQSLKMLPNKNWKLKCQGGINMFIIREEKEKREGEKGGVLDLVDLFLFQLVQIFDARPTNMLLWLCSLISTHQCFAFLRHS